MFVARRGRSELTTTLLAPGELANLVERMLRTSGRRIDMSTPFVDAMMPDGSRLHVDIPMPTRSAGTSGQADTDLTSYLRLSLSPLTGCHLEGRQAGPPTPTGSPAVGQVQRPGLPGSHESRLGIGCSSTAAARAASATLGCLVGQLRGDRGDASMAEDGAVAVGGVGLVCDDRLHAGARPSGSQLRDLDDGQQVAEHGSHRRHQARRGWPSAGRGRRVTSARATFVPRCATADTVTAR